jgi:NinB protein
MSHTLAVIHTEQIRQRVLECIKVAPIGSRVRIDGPKRTLPQNDKMWSLLGDIVAQKKTINGRLFKDDDWKIIFMQALGQEPDVLPTLDGTGFFETGHSSSKLDKETMSALIEYIVCWGAENGVQWSDPQLESYEEMRRE